MHVISQPAPCQVYETGKIDNLYSTTFPLWSEFPLKAAVSLWTVATVSPLFFRLWSSANCGNPPRNLGREVNASATERNNTDRKRKTTDCRAWKGRITKSPSGMIVLLLRLSSASCFLPWLPSNCPPPPPPKTDWHDYICSNRFWHHSLCSSSCNCKSKLSLHFAETTS